MATFIIPLFLQFCLYFCNYICISVFSGPPAGAVRFISLNESVIRAKIILRKAEMFKILEALECVNSGRYSAKSRDILIFQKYPQMSQFPFDCGSTLIGMSPNYTWGALWGDRELVWPSPFWLRVFGTKQQKILGENIGLKKFTTRKALAVKKKLTSASCVSSRRLCSAVCWHLV